MGAMRGKTRSWEGGWAGFRVAVGERGPERRIQQMRWLLVVGAVVLGLAGCAEGEVYEMAPDMRRCGRSLCVYGTELDTGREKTFIGGIDRFDFRWGVLQKVRLVENTRSDPAAIILPYRVVEVIDTKRVPAGTTFQLPLNWDLVHGSQASGFTLMERYTMTCVSEEVCAALEPQGSNSEEFTLELRYPSSEGEPLVVTRIL
jgi:hypothetical protein